MKTFQQPLSAEEEACCIQSMQEEGSERAREARTLLIERNLRLVAHIAKKYQNVDEDMEDCFAQTISPILCEGDAIGAVVLFSKDPKAKMGEAEQKLAYSAAGFLGRQMEQ